MKPLLIGLVFVILICVARPAQAKCFKTNELLFDLLTKYNYNLYSEFNTGYDYNIAIFIRQDGNTSEATKYWRMFAIRKDGMSCELFDGYDYRLRKSPPI